MTDKYNYKSISLRNHTYKKIGLLSNKLVEGFTLSKAKTVEVLINHYIDKFAKNNEGSVRNCKETEPQTI